MVRWDRKAPMLGYAPESWRIFSRRALTWPSRSPAISKSIHWARPWCMETMCSLRVSVQRTGPPVARAQRAEQHVLHVEALATEAAADVRGDDPHLLAFEAEEQP